MEETTRSDRNSEWRVALRAKYTTKERMALPRVSMPETDARWRITCSDEVNLGLSTEQAVLEARRCLDCPDPGCIKGCPVGNDIPGFIKNVQRRHFAEALEVINRTSILPAVCGRVCPQEKQCEASCIYSRMKKPPIAIGHIERFIADYNREADRQQSLDGAAGDAGKCGDCARLPIKIAVIGSGPSGLAFAADMARWGYDVTIFEALDRMGGVLKYGIPEFCLPKEVVDYEIDKLRQAGVKLVKDCFIGKTLTYEQLSEQGFKGIYIATGAGKPRFMDVPGENLPGVMTANEYLIRLNMLHNKVYGRNLTSLDGKQVAVIGGGNTAIDAVRFALRCGASRAMLVYRRDVAEMPARIEEIDHARDEGVEFMTLRNPQSFNAGDDGYLKSMTLQVMELGEPDSTGRRSPVPVEGKTETIDVDLVVTAIGSLPNPPVDLPGVIETSRQGAIVVDKASMRSGASAIYAGGDIVRGPATVILAMGDGRRAARAMADAIDARLRQLTL